MTLPRQDQASRPRCRLTNVCSGRAPTTLQEITLRDLLTFRAGYGEAAFLSPTCPLQKAMMEARQPLTEWIFAGTPDEFSGPRLTN